MAPTAKRWVRRPVQPARLVRQELLFRRFRWSVCRAHLVLGILNEPKRHVPCAQQGLTTSTSRPRLSHLACNVQQERFRQQRAPPYAHLVLQAPSPHQEDKSLVPHALLVPIHLRDRARARRVPKGLSATTPQRAPS